MLTEIQKTEIKNALETYIESKGSQNKAAITMRNVSAATLSQVRNGKWGNIDDKMWFSIAAQIGLKNNDVVATKFYNLFTHLLCDAQNNAFAYGVIANAGTGKTFTARDFATTNRTCYHVVCCATWSVQVLLTELLRAMGVDQPASTNKNALLSELTRRLKAIDRPLLILDEADKMGLKMVNTFIAIYNELEDYCGYILCATPYFQSFILKGIAAGHIGCIEFYSRVGSRFISLPANDKHDVRAICEANGIHSLDQQAEAYNDSKGDMRRVKRLIHAFKNEKQ